MPLWVTIALTIWGVIGPFAGLLAGHLLSQSSQRKHWIADCKKQEYGELLRALMLHHFSLEGYLGSPGPMVTQVEREIKEREEEATIVIKNRIFLRKQIEHLKVYEKWAKAVKEFRSSRDVPTFSEAFNDIQSMIWHEVERDLLATGAGSRGLG
jgi:hypothetical protein